MKFPRFSSLKYFILASIFCWLSPAQAQLTYELYFDQDVDTASGCVVNLPQLGENIEGIERRLVATVDRLSATVTSVDLTACEVGTFGTPQTIGGGYPVGLNVGENGSDVIELAAGLQAIGNNQSQVRVYVVAQNAASVSEDILQTLDGTPATQPIFIGLPFQIPTMSVMGLLILGLVLLGVGFVAIKRHRKILGIGLLVVTGSAIAMTFVADGDVADWLGLAPAATDPVGDGSSADNAVDINAFFAAIEDEMFFARVDVVDIENTPPVADPGADTTLEDNVVTLTLTGSDMEGDPLTFSISTPPANGTLGAITQVSPTSATVDYTPSTDFNGAEQFMFIANDGQSDSAPAAFDVTVTAVNDAPVFTVGPDQTVLEDAGAQVVNAWATGIAAGPATATDETGQGLTFNITNNTNTALFAVQPAVAADGTLTFTPADDQNGSATITLELMDDGGTANGGVDTSPTQTFDINVTAVNDAPLFTVGADQTVLEDAGAQSVNAWATGVAAGPATATDETGQTLTFNITNNTNAALFSAGPAVAADGTLTYTPASDANGTATITLELMDDGGTANGGVDTSAPQTFVINVTEVNDVPAFTVGPDQTVLEDAGAQSVPAWATGISAGPTNESSQTLTFNITNNTNAALFSTGPAVTDDGTLTFTPADDANGSATITLELMDDGGTANGGVDTSATQTFVINVTAVNDAPSFTAGLNELRMEDAGPQTVNGWATAISAGPADEAGQALTFNVTGNTFPGLFVAAPAVASDGTLSFTPAPDANGVATITLELMDNGGTANGGVDTSAAQSFTITVVAVNDAPTFTVGPDQNPLEDAGPQTINGWATGISAGPADESGQTLTFNITNNTNPGLFSSAPAVAVDGTLTYTSALNANGSATITLELMDNGGTALGGVDTSPTQNFTITVTPVNDPPIATDDSFDTVANTQLQVSAAQSVTPSVFVSGSVLDNDTDVDGPALTASLNTATAGTIVNVAADGTFTYVPPVGMTGTDSFTYDISDGSLTATGTVNITFIDRVWYVDNTSAAGGLGRSSDPFDTLVEAETAQAAGDMICVLLGDGTTTGYDTGFDFQASNVLLHGEHFGCEPAVSVNGNPAPVSLVAPSPGDYPMIASAAGANAVRINANPTPIIGVAVRGLDIAGDLDAIEVNAASGAGADATIEDNVIRSAGVHGIDINQGLALIAGESSTAAVINNILTTTADSIAVTVADNSIAGALTISIDDNTVIDSTTGAGILLDGPATNDGALTVTSFSGNTVTDAGVRGIDIDRVTFDAGSGTDAPGGNTVIGSIGNRVEGDGMRMNQVLGGVAFGTLDIFNNNGTGWFVRDAGTKVTGTFALSTTGGTVDTTNGTALDIDPVMVDLTFDAVSSTNANGQGSSNAFGGGIFMNVTDAQGGPNANALTVGTFDVTSSNGNALSIINSSGIFNFGRTTIDNLTVPSSGGAVNMRSNGGDNATLNFTDGLDIDIFDGGDPAGAAPGSRAINIDAFSNGRATFSVANTAGDESILIADSAGGFINLDAEFTTGSGQVNVGPAGIHFDSVQATGTDPNAELTGDGAIRMIEVGGAGTLFNIDLLDIVDGANTPIGITIEDSPVTYTFGSYNHQNGEASQTTPVILTGDNGPVTFNNVTLGNTSVGVIGQPFRITSNNNPVNILGGTIVAGSTTTGIQLINQDNSGSLTVTNTDISTTLANGGGDVLQVSGGGGAVTVNGGTFMTSSNSDGVDIQDTSANIDISADIVHTGVEASGIVPTLLEIDNTSGNISFTGTMNKTNDGPLMLIGKNGTLGGSGTGPTNGTISFSDTLSSGPGTDGIFINNVGVNAAIVFNVGAGVTVDSSAVSGINLTDNAGDVTFNEVIVITNPTNDGITLSDNTGMISFNVGGPIGGAGGDGVNCTNSVLDIDSVGFANTITGDTMEVTGCTLSGANNAATPLVCNDGGGNTGSVAFNLGADSCP